MARLADLQVSMRSRELGSGFLEYSGFRLPVGSTISGAAAVCASAGRRRDTRRAGGPSRRDLAHRHAIAGKRADREKLETCLRRVAREKPRAPSLVPGVLGAVGPAGLGGAALRGPRTPVELQIYYKWSPYLNTWVPLGARGGGTDDLCARQPRGRPIRSNKSSIRGRCQAPPTVSRAQVFHASRGLARARRDHGRVAASLRKPVRRADRLQSRETARRRRLRLRRRPPATAQDPAPR